MRDQFMLDPTITFLNHGSFGACPRVVFDAYVGWQRRLEYQPVLFLGRQQTELMAHAGGILADYVGVLHDSLVFVTNATTGLNTVIRSLKFEVGDEILTTQHEYGALDLTWQFVSEQTGAVYVRQPIPEPFTTTEVFVEAFWQGVTPRTKIIFMSHITSNTGLIFPVEAICARAQAEGIMTIIDGAHAPGQLDLDLTAMGVDVYSGNCHKWMCAPKGSAFLYVKPELHQQVHPLVISWGWSPTAPFVQANMPQGTQDIAAYLTVPDAIAYMAENDWPMRRGACHALAVETGRRISELFELPLLAPLTPDWVGQMIAAPLPPCDAVAVKQCLYDEFGIEAPLTRHADRDYIRLSYQVYNTSNDLETLMDALTQVFG